MNPTTQLVEAIKHVEPRLDHRNGRWEFSASTEGAILLAIADAVDAWIGESDAVRQARPADNYERGFDHGWDHAKARMRTFTAALREGGK